MADSAPNPLNGLIATALFGPKTQQQLMQNQQQQALAQSLMQQGATPLDTDHRQIGGVGYRIAPTEGLAKIAQQLVGTYAQQKANDRLSDIYSQMPQSGALNGVSGGQGGGAVYGSPGNPSMLGQMEVLNGNRAVAELLHPTPEMLNTSAAAQPGANPYLVNQVTNQSDPLQESTVNGVTAMRPTSQNRQLAGGGAAQPAPQPSPYPDYSQPQPVSPRAAIPPPPDPSQLAQTGTGNVSIGQNGINLDAPAPQPGASPAAVPPVAAAALAPPPGAAGPSQAGVPAAPSYGKVTLTPQQQAALDTSKAGNTKNAEKTGENLADMQKQYAIMQSNLPVVMQRLDRMRDANKIASYGYGVNDGSNAEEGPGFKVRLNQQLDNPTSQANAVIRQAAAQGILPELGPQLQQAGIRGNKFLETLSSSASGLNPADPPTARGAVIQGLGNQYMQNMKSLHDQISTLGGSPGDLPDFSQYNTSQFRDGQTATNPQTGHKMIFKNGAWVGQ